MLAGVITTTSAAQAPPQWRLQLMHSIRPAEGTPGMLGNVQGIGVREDGSAYVAEQNPPRVTLYDRSGAFARVVMKNGDGPAETRYPEITMQAETLVVYDSRQGRLSRIAPNGRLLGERRLDVNPGTHISASDDGRILLLAGRNSNGWDNNAVRIGPNSTIDTLHWMHPKSEDLAFIWEGPGWVLVGNTPFSPHGVAIFDPSGRVVIGGTRRSRWVVQAGRDTVQTVTLPDHPLPIARNVRDSAWATWYGRVAANKAKLPNLDAVVREDRIPTTLPPWVTLHIDRLGEWWIGRPGPDGGLASWDIVSNGRVVGHVPVPARVVDVPGSGSMLSFGKDVVAMLHEDEDGVPWIGVYRIVRSAH